MGVGTGVRKTTTSVGLALGVGVDELGGPQAIKGE